MLRDSMNPINKLKQTKDENVLEKILLIAWSLWSGRNKKVFENKLTHPQLEADPALSLMEDFKKKVVSQSQAKPSRSNLAWQCSLEDGTIFDD